MGEKAAQDTRSGQPDQCASMTPSLLIAMGLFLITPLLQAEPEIVIGGARMENEAGVPGVLGDVEAEAEELDPASDTVERDWEPVIAPLPSRNSALGWTLSVPAMLFYKPSFAQPQDSVWISGLFGFYAENDSWGGGALQPHELRR